MENGTRRPGRGIHLAVLVALVAVFGLVGCRPETTREPARPGLTALTIAGERVCWAEVVSDPDSIRRGLMYRTSLEPDCGMLFVFPEEEERSFWMKNTLIPLDIAYIRSDGTVVEVLQMEPEPAGTTVHKHYPSSEPVRYALEMKQGWFEKKGIKPGAQFERLPRRAARG